MNYKTHAQRRVYAMPMLGKLKAQTTEPNGHVNV